MVNKRQHPRNQTQLPITFAGDDVSAHGVIVDLSFGGCKVESAAAVLPGDFLGMLIRIPGRDVPIEIDLCVVRWSMGQSFGVEFIRMKADHQELLKRVLAKLEAGVSDVPVA